MAATEKNTPLSHITYSCYSTQVTAGENFIGDHVISCIISGSQEVYVGNNVYYFKEGDIRFFKKNQLAMFIKRPPLGGEFKTITLHISEAVLRAVGMEYELSANGPYVGENTLLLKNNHLLTGFLTSLIPYINSPAAVSEKFTNLKIKEAILLLLETTPNLKNLLFDFNEPHKIDLEKYMNENYRYNVELNSFAYLTGRSLSTFKRDFSAIFDMSPNRWLQMKRLKEAYYLIAEKKIKPAHVYLQMGFKDFSHFSFAFKKAFGVAPTRLNG